VPSTIVRNSGEQATWGERAHTWNLMFLYVKVSTLKPMVGIVVMTSPIWSRYRIVVFPADANDIQ
jgi:hypothetical protein